MSWDAQFYPIRILRVLVTYVTRWMECKATANVTGAPTILVPKKVDVFRLVVDYRDLNSVTVDDSYPLPRLEVLLYRAGRAKFFSKIDLASGFHQIEVHPGSRPMTAFRLPEPMEGCSL